MKSLWAPWRMEFIASCHTAKKSKGKNHHGKTEDCLFCHLSKQKRSVNNLVLYKGRKAYIVLNRYPYTNGHLMIMPKRHLKDFDKLNNAEFLEMGRLIARSIRALKKVVAPQGFNVGLNLGRAAGAGIEGHLHAHVVPRWIGDSNFMPVVGEIRVLPEFITKTYKKLITCF